MRFQLWSFQRARTTVNPDWIGGQRLCAGQLGVNVDIAGTRIDERDGDRRLLRIQPEFFTKSGAACQPELNNGIMRAWRRLRRQFYFQNPA